MVQRPVNPGQSDFDQALGRAVSSWQAWAIDPETRFRGSSGGVLTALAQWAVESGRSTRVIGAGADLNNPRQSVPVELHRGSDFLRQSGSRYAPVSIGGLAKSTDPSSVVVGKPCEASGLRQLMTARGQSEMPLIFSFFCAGVPSQRATDRLLNELGIPADSPLRTLRYRGHGWPGSFHAETLDGVTASTSYDESWGKQLGPSMQWRCKVCPDGVGESADLVAGDFWKTDEKGYPLFANSEGVSALIARTMRGHELILAALESGVIGAEPLELRHISSVQPYQVERRATLWARLFGRRVAGWQTPSYQGFGLFRQALGSPARSLRYAYGSFRRSWKRSRSRL
ncbi:Coenzyme F420 hydrogenase/dehydrogenase, beta subunit C-terminal domain [Pseudarthrobacter sp. SL88]|uniref:Coenzyme F420 hydrogenase/dehydrogenase, beta subunit C-terminal domain n=1 Tax=Pseudarthrobacter sp. SL88 TaxID=2994666 RepID=UPI003FA3C418